MKRFSLLVPLISIVPLAWSQNVWFVDASNTGSQTGQSWSTAIADLQQAMDSASNGDTILVAKGTYYPTTIAGGGSHERDKAFILKTHARIYGGFAGTESGLSERSNDSTALHITNRTILSGNIGNPNDATDNAYHVVVSIIGNYASIVDGFEISGGYADSASTKLINGQTVYRNVGGGINTRSSNTTFSNCIIKDNVAKRGGGGINNTGGGPFFEWCTITINMVLGTYNQNPNGGGAGMRNDNCDVSITNSRFIANESYTNQGGGAMRNENGSDAILTNVVIKDNYCEDGDGGGGMYNYYNSSPTLTNVSFISNSTENQGGAMYNHQSTPSATNCLFLDNFATGGAGAIESDDNSTLVLTECQFIGNATEGDGGALQNWKSSPIISNCLFEGNHADGDGGAIYNYTECDPWISNTSIRENSCDGNGGGVYNRRDCNPILTQVLIFDNYAGNNGGGIYTITSNSAPCSPIATNVTITRNEAGNSGGGAFDDGMGSSRLKNSIIFGNTASSNDEVDAPAASAATNVVYSIIGTDYYTFGTNPPTAFTNAVFFDPINDDFHLASTSPGLNVGDSSYYASSATPDISFITEDLDGNPRVMGTNIDLGVYEVCTDTITPEVSISVAPGDSVLDSTVVTFTSSANVTAITQYQWYNNNNAIVGETAATYIAMAGVDFVDGDSISLLIESHEQCAIENTTSESNMIGMTVTTPVDTTDTTNNDTVTGIWKNKAIPTFRVYPNPTNAGLVTIETDGKEAFNVSIYDLTGRMLLSETLSSSNQSLDISHLQPSTYVVSIKQKDGISTSKRFVITP